MASLSWQSLRSFCQQVLYLDFQGTWLYGTSSLRFSGIQPSGNQAESQTTVTQFTSSVASVHRPMVLVMICNIELSQTLVGLAVIRILPKFCIPFYFTACSHWQFGVAMVEWNSMWCSIGPKSELRMTSPCVKINEPIMSAERLFYNCETDHWIGLLSGWTGSAEGPRCALHSQPANCRWLINM